MSKLKELADEMRDAGVAVVTIDPSTGVITHCALDPNRMAAAQKQTQTTDEDRKRAREDLEAYKSRLRLAATGGPSRRVDPG